MVMLVLLMGAGHSADAAEGGNDQEVGVEQRFSHRRISART